MFGPSRAARHQANKLGAAGKAEAAARRNEKLSQRNPERIQKQIDDLKQITSSGGKLSKHEETVLESLERDLKAVKKAREALGDQAPTFSRGDGPRFGGSEQGRGVLGKRRRDFDDASSSDGDVPSDVKTIPMPRDTPPPIPKEILDQWYAKRRAKRANANANDTPLGDRKMAGTTPPVQPAPVAEPKAVYEAKPVLRDLRKEAVSAFVPTAVKMKLEKSKGQGGLMEPEEADRLEREGYLKAASGAPDTEPTRPDPRTVTMEEVGEDEV